MSAMRRWNASQLRYSFSHGRPAIARNVRVSDPRQPVGDRQGHHSAVREDRTRHTSRGRVETLTAEDDSHLFFRVVQPQPLIHELSPSDQRRGAPWTPNPTLPAKRMNSASKSSENRER